MNYNNIKIGKGLLIIICLIWILGAKAQIVCADVEIVPNTSEHVDYVFDSFSKYIAGITYHGSAKVNVKVDDQAPPNPDCKWMLTMSVENNPSSGTGANQWETLSTYGAGSSSPAKIDILKVRVTNICNTSPIDGIYQNFIQTGDFIEIIENTGIRVNAGSCQKNVNGPGNYLINYDEFHFQIDFRIVPNFGFDPGVYQLQVKFALVEVP
ncbi:MAG: hypothetical protein K8R86_09230 [Bacteroidales bacterium]|nr:hypothetical protein [Bacteroidales bacterium]